MIKFQAVLRYVFDCVGGAEVMPLAKWAVGLCSCPTGEAAMKHLASTDPHVVLALFVLAEIALSLHRTWREKASSGGPKSARPARSAASASDSALGSKPPPAAAPARSTSARRPKRSPRRAKSAPRRRRGT